MAEEQVRDTAQLELLSPASLGIICFRRRFGGEDEETAAALSAELVSRFERTGRGLVSSTRLHGTYAIRLCVMNHTTGPRDVRDTLEWFARSDRPSVAGQVGAPAEGDPRGDVLHGWGQADSVPEEVVREVPLLAHLKGRALSLVVQSARELRVEAGHSVVERWQGTRHFCAILEGEVEIRRDDTRVGGLGPGDFFGELAALDWGGGFGYVRTATVRATEPARLLVLPPAALAELVRLDPEVERRIRATARERLQRI
jgi:aromatic-L-amino-acid/L-tryptophan decarboxylase